MFSGNHRSMTENHAIKQMHCCLKDYSSVLLLFHKLFETYCFLGEGEITDIAMELKSIAGTHQ